MSDTPLNSIGLNTLHQNNISKNKQSEKNDYIKKVAQELKKPMTQPQRKSLQKLAKERGYTKKPVEDERVTESIRSKVLLYYKYFPSLIPEKSKAIKTPTYWKEELDRCRQERRTINSVENVRYAHIFFCGGLTWFTQYVYNPVPQYSLLGLTESLVLQPKIVQEIGFEDEFKELAIEYPSLFSTGPIPRLLQKTLKLIHVLNTHRSVMGTKDVNPSSVPGKIPSDLADL